MGYIYMGPSNLHLCMSWGYVKLLRDVWVGRCSSKAFRVSWDSLGGLCNHTMLSAKIQLSLHSILHAASSLGMAGSTMVQVLV